MAVLQRRTSLVSLKTEIGLVKTFRLILPVAFLAISFWTFEIGADGQTAILNYLGQSARHLFFFAALVITAGLYLFLGAYEKRIFFENRQQHSKNPLFMKRIED
jgi:hypothetical protein